MTEQIVADSKLDVSRPTRPSALARCIDDLLAARGESVTVFTSRSGINTAGFYRFLGGTNQSLSYRNLGKTAAGLGMARSQLLLLAELGEAVYGTR